MKKTATVSVNMEQYNEDEVGVSVWACPLYSGGRVGWCGRCLSLRVGVSACVGGGVVGSAEGKEEVGGRRWSLISSRHTQHVSTQQVVTNKKCCMYTHART